MLGSGAWRFNALIPGSTPGPGRTFWLRVMTDFDDLSPKYASSHSANEVCEWFSGVGLKDVKALPRATSVQGLKG